VIHSTDIEECTYITLNTIEIPTVTKSAHSYQQQPRGQEGPSQIEEEPKEPGTSRENDRDSTPTKAMAPALRIGLERTSITKDLGEAISSARTIEGANSSPLADESSIFQGNWSPLDETSFIETNSIELRSTETEHGSMENTEQLRKKLDDMVHRTKENFHTETSMEIRRMSKRRAGKQRQVDPESPMLIPTEIVEEGKDFAVDNDVLKSENVEMRHSLQRRFRGTRLKPHTAPWIAQQIHEDPTPTAVGFLRMWTHRHKQVEATESTIAQLNELSDEDVILALEELHEPRKYIQGTGGNKLSIRTILTTRNNEKIIETFALVDSGSTGSCIHRRVVEEYQIPTKNYPAPSLSITQTDR